VRVVVVSAGPGWLVTAIAVLGLVLAVVSLSWQVVIFRWSGSRVRVESRLALLPEVAGAPVFPDDKMLSILPAAEIRRMVPTAVIRNTGRLPVTVERCTWQAEHAFMDASDSPLGESPPCRLEAHAACYATLAPENVAELFHAARMLHQGDCWDLWPVAELGNGKIRTGGRLKIPLVPGDARLARRASSLPEDEGQAPEADTPA
jgi:hypothetical protein